MSIRENSIATANGRALKRVYLNEVALDLSAGSAPRTRAPWTLMAFQAVVPARTGHESPPRATGVLP